MSTVVKKEKIHLERGGLIQLNSRRRTGHEKLIKVICKEAPAI